MSDLIDQHKRMAMGMGVDAEPIASCFGKGRNIHGKSEVSRKGFLSNSSRGLKSGTKDVDHGPNDMKCLDRDD